MYKKTIFTVGFSLLLTVVCLFSGACRIEAAEDPLGTVVFFGDSTTAHLIARGGVPAERVWSGAGNTVLFETVNKTKCVHLKDENIDLTLAEAVKLKKPAYLIITLGVSGGAGFLPEEKFVSIYRTMLESVKEASPDTVVFVQSILPLSDKSHLHYTKLTKEAVAEANGWIRTLCAEMEIPYIDTHPRLLDDNGYLKKIYQNDEYMHLTSAAYTIVLDSIREAISGYSG